MKKICTIIINYFGFQMTEKCIRSLIGQGIDTIHLVDNSVSNNESSKLIDIVDTMTKNNGSPDIHLHINEDNLGFGKAINRVIRNDLETAGGHEFYMIINNDAQATPAMVEKLLSAMEQRDNVSLIAPLIVTGKNNIGYFWYDKLFGSITLKKTFFSFPYLTGCCLVFRKNLVQEQPLFDEDFFMYGEDVFLNWRIQKQGKSLCCINNVMVLHEGTGSSSHGGFFYEHHLARGHILIAMKTAGGFLELLLFLTGRVLYLTARALIRSLRYRSPSPILALLSCWFPLKIRLKKYVNNNDNTYYNYQKDFSDHNISMYDVKDRLPKARKIMAVIQDYLQSIGRDPKELNILDIGCSAGYLTRYYGNFFKQVTGMDIDEKAVTHAMQNNTRDNVTFRQGDAMAIDSPSEAFDIVTCSQIYEHVPDAQRMMLEIFRVLKPDGICIFIAGNRLNLMEHHYRLPLLSVIPKWLAHHYIRLAGKADSYYETHLTLWGLKKLVKDFTIIDYTKKVIQDPVKYSATDMITPGSRMHTASKIILRIAYWLCPTYIWILKKK